MADWRNATIGELTENFDARRRPVKASDRRTGPYPYYGASGIVDHVDGFIFDGEYLLIAEDGENLKSRSTPIAFLAQGKFWVNNHAHVVRGGREADTRFLAYALALVDVNPYLSGSAQPKLSRSALDSIKLRVPDLHEQRAIAEVLGALDDKVAANTRLAELGTERLSSEFERLVSGDSRTVELDAVGKFLNRRRIPLSSRERDLRPGPVPYYGASGIFGWVDEAIFDERILLVGEDGSVITDERRPVTQYVWGPSWVNNHAHVIVGRGVSTEVLYLAVRRADVSTLVTGAVQPKISMGNLKRLEIDLPGARRAADFEPRVAGWFAMYRALMAENRTLAAARDTLLPALMSGRLRVHDAEAVVADAT